MCCEQSFELLWQTSGFAQFPCSIRKAYQKLDTRVQRFSPDSAANEIIALTLRWARAKKRSCLLGQGHRLRRLHAIAGGRDGPRDASAQRIQGYTRHEIVGRYLVGSYLSSQTVFVRTHARMQALPDHLCDFNRTRPGAGINIALATSTLQLF